MVIAGFATLPGSQGKNQRRWFGQQRLNMLEEGLAQPWPGAVAGLVFSPFVPCFLLFWVREGANTWREHAVPPVPLCEASKTASWKPTLSPKWDAPKVGKWASL